MIRAKKGDVVAYSFQRSYVTADYRREVWTVIRLGVAEACSRDGKVRKLRQAGYGTVVDVDRDPRVTVPAVCPAAMLRRRVTAEELPSDDFATLSEASEAIAPLKKTAPITSA